MTNKKLKLAAMSVALTACVAAQPMAAHAVEGPDSVEDNAAPQAEPAPVEGKTAEGEVEGEEEKQEEFVPPVNKEAKEEEQAPAFGPGTKTDDIIIDYKPAEKPEEPGKSGEDGEADGSEGSGETDETENPDGTYVKGDVIDNSKKDEATGKDGKIGEATKEETPDSSSSTTVVDPDAEVKKGESVVGKDEDGNTTITTPTETTGTQTTTTTGTGKADSETTITDTKKGEEIDLNKELKNKDGEVDKPTWETKTDDKLGDYTVKEVEDTKGDPNSKTLTLKKTSEPETKEIEMSAEDVAKLLDVPEDGVEKKEELDEEGNPKTTYILKKEETSTDENGNTVTRVTYYKITGNTVETTTETTLVLKVEKGTVDVDDKDLTTEIELPSITAKNTDETKTDVIEISSEKLGEMLQDEYYNNVTGEYVYTETDANGKEYTYKVKKTEDTKQLTNKQLADRLGEGFTGDDNGVYYNGEKLTFDQKEAVRKTLSYTVEVTEVTKTPGQIEGGNAKKEQAENDAKLAAIRDALTKAAEEAGIDTTGTDFEAKLKDISSTGADSITFTYTDNDGNQHTVTFQYDGATFSTAHDKTGETTVGGKDAEDVTNNTVTGTAYVTGGKESWSETKEITGSGSILGNDFTKLPDGVTEEQVVRDGKNRITKIQTDNDVYEFTYNDNASLPESELEKLRAEAKKNGWSFNEKDIEKNLTAVTWKKTTTQKDETAVTIPAKKDTIVEVKTPGEDGKENISYTLKVNDTTYEGFTTADGGKTYTKTDGNKITTITVTETPLNDVESIKALLAQQYDVSASKIELNKDGTASWSDSKGTVVTVEYSKTTQKLTVTETTTDSVNKTKMNDLVAAVQEKVNKLEKGDQLTLKGKQTYTITMDANGQLSMKDDLDKVVKGTANVNEKLTEVIKQIASNYISYGDLKPEDIWNLLDQQQVYADGTNNKYNPGGCDSYWPEAGYENNGGEWKNGQYVAKKDQDGNIMGEVPAQPTTNFDHLGLDADVDITTEDGSVINGLLLSDGLTFTYGRKEQIAGHVDMDKYPDKNYNGTKDYDKNELHKTTGALDAKLNTDVKETAGQVWNGNSYDTGSKLTYTCLGEGTDSNAFSGKRFYKVTGNVAYDMAENGKGLTKEQADALVASLSVMEDSKDAQAVKITRADGTVYYNVYKKVTNIEAIGYMTASANTAANQNRGSWTPGTGTYSGNSNAGDYDLRIQGLKLVNGKVQGNYGIDYSLGMELIQNKGSESNNILSVSDRTTTTTTSGCDKYGDYTVSYTKNYNWTGCHSKGIKGTGTGSSYKTFTEVLKKFFTGSGSKEHDEGKVSYTHRTTDKVNTTPVSKETVTTTDAHVDYNYTSIETRTVTVDGEETVIVPPVTPPVDPDTPDGPVEDETPDEVVTPETPELPAVQDAAPDEVVLPAEPELPAVQDATALPQTGVNWFTALGMAFSGILLTIAGAFASLKYKEKH